MRESSSSLRWYFGIIGVFYFFSVALVYGILGNFGALGVVTNSPFFLIQNIVSGVESIGFIYLAIMLPKYLNPESVKYVLYFVLATFGATLVWSVVGFATSGQIGFVNIAISALITWYLYRNAQRLAIPPARM